MRIENKLKLRPFSTRPGTKCLIPHSHWQVEIFPALLRFSHLDEVQEVRLPLEGPVKGFTIFLDMEKERIEVFGRGVKGFFRYYITPCAVAFAKGETIATPFVDGAAMAKSKSRLFLGVTKKQDWELVKRRHAMEEVFPFWVRLSQIIPFEPAPKRRVGTMALLHKDSLDLLFQAGFEGILAPRLSDRDHHGVIPPESIPLSYSPLCLLHEGARLIRELFFIEEGEEWYFLPTLPKEFHAGGFTKVETVYGDLIDMEWSKKRLKKVIIHSTGVKQIQIKLKGLKTFRVRTNLKGRGVTHDVKEPLALKKGQTLYLDRFLP